MTQSLPWLQSLHQHRCGSHKPGDKVLATNTRTGKTRAEPVTAILVHHDTNRYNLTIQAGHHTAVIHTTSNHLFWDLAARRWVKAAALKHGRYLDTTGRRSATVARGGASQARSGWMWDLTVATDHDFYVQTATTTVLVHNCTPGQAESGPAAPAPAPETFFRTMSKANSEQLHATGRVPATSETFISPSQEYAQGYNGVTVRFSVRAGTQDALAGIGIRDSSAVSSAAYPAMPSPQNFSGWTRTSAYFKGEGGILNIGLGRGPALDIFNDAILGFEVLP